MKVSNKFLVNLQFTRLLTVAEVAVIKKTMKDAISELFDKSELDVYIQET